MRALRLSITQKILLVVAFLFLSFSLGPPLIWLLIPDQPLGITVIDKTAGPDLREHSSIFWMLHHWNYVDPSTGAPYDGAQDYYGFFPRDSAYSRPASLDLAHRQLLYIADTYGVYQTPVSPELYEKLISKNYIPSKLVYGGMNDTEVSTIEAFDKAGGAIVAEFNTLQRSALFSARNKGRMEKIFRIHLNGVTGRYYDHLQDAPLWMKDAYAAQNHHAWDFTREGIIIVDGRSDTTPNVIVLDKGDLHYVPLLLKKRGHPFLENVAGSVPFYNFFEYLQCDSPAVTLADFELQCTEQGKKKLNKASLPMMFPAVVASGPSLRKFYFAGDFADKETQPIFVYYTGIEYPLKPLLRFYLVSDQTRFFWRFYMPLMNTIFKRSIELSAQKKSTEHQAR